MNKVCPKKYGSYDLQCYYNCKECKQGKLYQVCVEGKDHLACAGWLGDKGTYCCAHYPEEKEKNDLVH